MTHSIVRDFNIKLLIANVAMSFVFLLFTYITTPQEFFKTLIEHSVLAIGIQVAAYFLLKKYVVAPIHLISPLDNAGFNKFATSILLLPAAPAPTII